MTNEEKLERMNQGLLGRFFRRLGRVAWCVVQPFHDMVSPGAMHARAHKQLEEISPPVISDCDTHAAFRLKMLRLQNTVDVYRLAGQPYEIRIHVRMLP